MRSTSCCIALQPLAILPPSGNKKANFSSGVIVSGKTDLCGKAAFQCLFNHTSIVYVEPGNQSYCCETLVWVIEQITDQTHIHHPMTPLQDPHYIWIRPAHPYRFGARLGTSSLFSCLEGLETKVIAVKHLFAGTWDIEQIQITDKTPIHHALTPLQDSHC